jgi:cytochrome b pre-mRNA-processing protein 3
MNPAQLSIFPYSMILQLFASRPADPTIDALYGAIVAQARLSSFYLAYGVPDTVEGRFDMIVLHLALVLRRLAREAAPVRNLGQAVFDRFCRDMDHNLREMGVGDLSVPKEMRRLAGAFYGRAEVYEHALAASDDGLLAAALARNVLAEVGPLSVRAMYLATYAREVAHKLDQLECASLADGVLSFPDPDAVLETAARKGVGSAP